MRDARCAHCKRENRERRLVFVFTFGCRVAVRVLVTRWYNVLKVSNSGSRPDGAPSRVICTMQLPIHTSTLAFRKRARAHSVLGSVETACLRVVRLPTFRLLIPFSSPRFDARFSSSVATLIRPMPWSPANNFYHVARTIIVESPWHDLWQYGSRFFALVTILDAWVI